MSRIYLVHPQVPAGLVAAFYKGNRDGFGGITSRLGRMLDHGPYSHSELILPSGLSWSASLPDKGVRAKPIGYSSPHKWDFLPIPDPTGAIAFEAEQWYLAHDGEPYDVWGNVRFLTNFVSHSADKWFCSESNMAALGYPEPWRYGPSGMAVTLQHEFKTQMTIGSACA